MVLSAVLTLRKASSIDWPEAQKHLGDPGFLKQLIEYPKDNMPDALLKKVEKYTANVNFDPEKVGKVSKAAKSLCMWVRAMHQYGLISKTVAPKREKLREAMLSLDKKQSALREAQARLQKVIDKVQALKSQYDESVSTKERLREESESLETKLDRAAKLVSGLSGERVRWEASVAVLENSISLLIGDCVVAAGFLSYCGPFNSDYRNALVLETWIPKIHQLNVPCSDDFACSSFLSEPTEVREWSMKGLPADSFSVENGVLVTRGRRWPLIVDPQAQANKWIKNLEKDRGLRVVDMKMADWMRTMENAIQFGNPVLLQDILEEVDPAIEPILSKAITKRGNRMMIKLGDKELDYNPEFKFYLTTKLSNPHYPPEVSTKTTIVNFAIKEQGLEDQLLSIVVKKERSDLEEKKTDLVIKVAQGKSKLTELEDKILFLLSSATGSLLDDDNLVRTLQSSKVTSEEVKAQIRVAEQTEKSIDAAREGYRPIAFRSSLLYFVLNDMAAVDPMYQFSLDSYFSLFIRSIEKSPKSDDITERIKHINEFHTYAVYRNTCRGLFEKHKLLFAFHMCVKILEGMKKVNREEYSFFLKGGTVLNKDQQPPNPAQEWLPDTCWDHITELDKLPNFRDIMSSFEQSPGDWFDWYLAAQPEKTPLVGDWENKLNELQRLVLIRCTRSDRVIFASTSFIVNNLGPKFVEPPPFDLGTVFNDSKETTPLIFVLSPGIDPISSLSQFATQIGMGSKLKSLALGQGQSVIASRMIEEGMRNGDWVFLANCHLMLSWMPTLEKIVEGLQSSSPHKDFRLWLSSYPHPKFPISILQNGLKMTTEPPRGLKANLTRLYNGITESQFGRCTKVSKYKKLLFSLCYFHSVLVERRKFGTLGWNIPYDFNESDFEISENVLSLYLDTSEETPWDALKYLIAEANYGGRVTDDWDFRLLRTYIKAYFCEDAITAANFKLSALPTYRIPDDGSLQSYKDYINSLPNVDDPLAFGQHNNADISAQIQETSILLDTLSLFAPQVLSSATGSKDTYVLKLAAELFEAVPVEIDREITSKSKEDDPSALNVFLLQEIDRFNALDEV